VNRPMEVSVAQERLRKAGWFTVEAPHIQGETVTWTVTCNRREQQIAAYGPNRIAAWEAAVKMAMDVDDAPP
jgi:hypothetical protein